MPGNLRDLPGPQSGENLASLLEAAMPQALYLLLQAQVPVLADTLQFGDFLLEFLDGLLEFQKGQAHCKHPYFPVLILQHS